MGGISICSHGAGTGAFRICDDCILLCLLFDIFEKNTFSEVATTFPWDMLKMLDNLNISEVSTIRFRICYINFAIHKGLSNESDVTKQRVMGGRVDNKGWFCSESFGSRFFSDTYEGSLGNAETWIIREYDFLITEGWKNGVQHGKNSRICK